MKIKYTAKLHLTNSTGKSQGNMCLFAASAMASQIEERKVIAMTVRHSKAPPCKTWMPKAVNTIRVAAAIRIDR